MDIGFYSISMILRSTGIDFYHLLRRLADEENQ